MADLIEHRLRRDDAKATRFIGIAVGLIRQRIEGDAFIRQGALDGNAIVAQDKDHGFIAAIGIMDDVGTKLVENDLDLAHQSEVFAHEELVDEGLDVSEAF